MEDLSVIREKINEIDNKIIDLWKDRMEICLSVAQYKKENNLPILDEKREKELLDRIGNLAGDELDSYARTLYETIMSISRSYQEKHLDDNK
jgi:chorismate mutase/prephenate dehydratase